MSRKQATIENTAISRPREPDLVPGYRLEKLVGKGGMGEVHKAIQLSLGRTVAVKLLSPELAKDPLFVTRFEKEAAALAALSHPHIVTILEKGKTDSTYFLVMEFVDGPSLREVMRSPLLDTTSALKMALEICRAIDYAHHRGIIHRDLKPENILFDEQAGGIAKVSDFGLAAFADNDQVPAKFNVTETHVSMGTLSYMAPEQRVDAKNADHRADIYSLGVILYELVVGEVPVGNYDPPSSRKPGVDRRLDAIVARCLKPLPNDRYGKTSELIADLEPLVPLSFSQLPHKLSRLELIKLRLKRALTRAGRVAALVLVLAAAAIVGLSLWRGRGGAPTRGLPGESIASATQGGGVLTVSGRSDESPTETSVALFGDGPDKLSLVAKGRPLSADPAVKGVVFARTGDEPAPAHAYLDVATDGDALRFEADTVAQRPSAGLLSGLKGVLNGAAAPEARTALVLLGEPGRYAALVAGGAGGPASLEWALGDKKRGTTLGGSAGREGAVTHLELSIDKDGELRAFAGSGKDRRPIGEPVSLGKGWRSHFQRAPRPALGCLDGGCQFSRVVVVVNREPPPAPVAPPPAPQPVKAAAVPHKGTTTVKAAAPVRKVAAPVKKTGRSSSPPKKKRR